MTESVTISDAGSGTVLYAAGRFEVRRPSHSDGTRNTPEPIGLDTACYSFELMQMMVLIWMR
jgi:hypothetical protein